MQSLKNEKTAEIAGLSFGDGSLTGRQTGRDKGELGIPDWITSDNKFMAYFVRGLLDTDGSVYCTKDYNYPNKGFTRLRITISSISKNLIKELSGLLTNLGINNSIIKDYKPKNPNCKEFSKLQIAGRGLVKYFELVGSRNPKHITKYQVWKRLEFCPPRTTLKQRKSLLAGLGESAGVSEPGQIRLAEAI